ncbi:hypothetical protein Vadar_020272 [Vaccinium darrowii]|uniref:Uncharacterized protein n=1 Tax=Vaccinium darrowii TaxID=229202 RepID=A0ACB7X288_9ERIC|nr:hypothetical protein Vadar_020272 [Vaccinium darrowii]
MNDERRQRRPSSNATTPDCNPGDQHHRRTPPLPYDAAVEHHHCPSSSSLQRPHCPSSAFAASYTHAFKLMRARAKCTSQGRKEWMKTSNILLDENFNAKLSDFRLPRQGPVQGSVAGLSHVSTSVSNHDVKFWEYQTIQKPMKTDGARMKIRKVTHGPSIQAWRRGSKPLERPAKNGKKRC